MKFDPALLIGVGVIGLFLVTSCGQRRNNPDSELAPYYATNIVTSEGKLEPGIGVTNGITLYCSQSNLVMKLNKEADVVFKFDSETLRLLAIELTTAPTGDQPAQDVLDVNADGIPDVRRLRDQGREIRQVFYQGEWYSRSETGSNHISVNGRDVKVKFDGRSWVEVE